MCRQTSKVLTILMAQIEEVSLDGPSAKRVKLNSVDSGVIYNITVNFLPCLSRRSLGFFNLIIKVMYVM